MGEKQTIGGSAPKPVLTADNKAVKKPVIRTMQKDIDSLRERGSAETPQNLPVAEESIKKTEKAPQARKKDSLIKRIISRFKKSEETLRKEEEQKKAQEQRVTEEQERIEAEKIIEVQKEAERQRKIEQRKILEEQRITKERKIAREKTIKEEQDRIEEQGIIEEKKRIEKQKKLKEEQGRIEAEKVIEKQKKQEEQDRIEAEKVIEVQKKAEEQRIIEERKQIKERKISEEQKTIEERKKAKEREKAKKKENELAEKIRRKEEKIREKKDKQSQKKAIQEQKKKLRALKVAALKSEVKTKLIILAKFSFIGLIIVLILGGIGGFLYWWNYIRVITPPIAPTHYQCQNSECVVVEGEGANQCQTDQDCRPTQPTIPQLLIPFGGVEIIELEFGYEDMFVQKLERFLEKEKEYGEIDNVLVEITSQTEIKYANLSEFISFSGINLPDAIVQTIVASGLSDTNYTLLSYNQTEGKRLGFIIKITEEADLGEVLINWEANICEDLQILFTSADKTDALSATTKEFQDNIYKDITIRYLNLPNPDLSVDYAIIDALLVIMTSKESMYAVIDALEPVAE